MERNVKEHQLLTARIPLVGSYFHRDDQLVDTSPGYIINDSIDQRFVNCIFKKLTNPISGKSTISVAKRPGFVNSRAFANVATDGCMTASLHEGTLYSAWVSSTADQIRIFEGNTSSATASHAGIVRASRLIPFENGGNLTLAFIGFGTAMRGWLYDTVANTLTEITDAQFPTACRGNLVYKDGYLFILTSGGAIYNSVLNTPTSWTANRFINTSVMRRGSTLNIYMDKIVAFSEETIEFFEIHADDDPDNSALRRIDELRIDGFGVQSTTTRTNSAHQTLMANGTIFWLNNSTSIASPRGIYMLENFKPKKISTPNIDSLLFGHGATSVNNITFSGIVKLNGYSYLVIASNDADVLLLYNFDTETWVTWNPTITADSKIIPTYQTNASTHCFIIDNNEYSLSVDTTSTLTYQDNSQSYAMTIQTSKFDFDTVNRKRQHRLSVVGNDARKSSTTAISWSDDDYQTFSTTRNVNMNDARPYLSSGGMFRRRAFKITNSANAPFEAEALEIDYSILNS